MTWEALADVVGSFLGTPKPPVPQPPKPPVAPIAPAGFQPYDQREADILAQLHPVFRARLQDTLQKCRAAGLAVYIFEGMRSIERQKELYAKGRDAAGNVIDKKQVVTNAKPGSSFHNYGIAADLVFDGVPTTPKIDWSWDAKWPWAQMGHIAQSCGLEWAGAWVTFPENPHVQLITPGLKWQNFLALYTQGGLKAVWDKIGY